METYPTTASDGTRIPNPSMPIDYGVKSNNITFTSDAGNTDVRPRGRLKKTFSFSYLALTKSQYKAIRDFFIARKGTYESFYWYDPIDHEKYTVRFSMEEFIGKNFGHNPKTPLYSLDIKLEEVL